ncbi:hypothetical protein GF376_00555 [Candidatus Peregrinibacteria bacterium]|nr:hypothetical protein [Candidatus Peregrinibacteria bacterium]
MRKSSAERLDSGNFERIKFNPDAAKALKSDIREFEEYIIEIILNSNDLNRDQLRTLRFHLTSWVARSLLKGKDYDQIKAGLSVRAAAIISDICRERIKLISMEEVIEKKLRNDESSVRKIKTSGFYSKREIDD